MDITKKYPADLVRTFALSYNFLYTCNLRFYCEKESFMAKYWRFLFILPSVALFYITLSIHIIGTISQRQIFKVAYLMPVYLVCTEAILKAIVLFKNMPKLTEIIKEIGSLWATTVLTDSQKQKKESMLKKLHFCNLFLYWISICGSLQYLISPGLETLFRRFILREDSELLLPLSCSYPLTSTDNWLIYTFIYIFQSFNMLLIVFVYAGGELIMITLSAILATEFTLLQEDLLRLKPITNKKWHDTGFERNCNRKALKEFVKRHQKLIELSRKLDDVFNCMIFLDMLFVGITTCFFRYAGQFSRGLFYSLTNYIAVFSSMLPVLYLCYYGELLTGASAGIGDMAYQTLWFEAGTHYQKTVWLIIKRSQTPCCLTSLRYAQITLNTFTKVSCTYGVLMWKCVGLSCVLCFVSITVLRRQRDLGNLQVMSTTWSYFSLMNTVYGKEL